MDCGIKAHAAVALAKTYGIDFIVCDHHVPEGGLPDAVANLDPKRSDCAYPYKELSGCGISFKLAQAFASYHGVPVEELNELLDLVAVSIACDIVPMTGENRVLAHLGLKCLHHSPSIGLWALMQRTNRPIPLNINDLVFAVGPLINAAGRLGDARDAVRLMLSADRHSALDYAGKLVRQNKERREVDHLMASEASSRVLTEPGMETNKSIVLFSSEWHKGIIGIAASRMAERFHRPAVILTESNGRAVGSARSVPGFDLYAALQSCEDLFYSYGGHAHAAGMQMPLENVPAFAERFETIVQREITGASEQPVLEICGLLPLEAITPAFWKMLKRFEPFGPHNRNPLFFATDVMDTGHSRLLDNNHVRFSIKSTNGKSVFGGIGFGLSEKFQQLKDQPFDIVFNIREEYWRGERGISLQIKDLRPKI
jgi:single-stranded-DNA-specific exonuclease